MKSQFLPLLLIVSSIAAVAQVPESVPAAPLAAPVPSVPASTGAAGTSSPVSASGTQDPLIGDLGSSAGTLGTTSLGSPAAAEIVTPSTRSPPGGAVSLASIEDRFSQLDTNHNRYLSPEELNLISRDMISSSAVRFNQMDSNHDGKVSAAEYSAAQGAMVQSGTGLPTNSSSTAPTSASAAESGRPQSEL